MTGNLEIHKSDGRTKSASAVAFSEPNFVAVWGNSEDPFTNEVEPDIVVRKDKVERVEREGKSWKLKSLSQRARERDDVDEDEINL